LRVTSAPHRLNGYLVPATGGASAWITTLGTAFAIAFAYFWAARLGLAMLAKPADVAVFWPASGVAAGILISAGRRAGVALVVGVLVGTVAANLMSDRSFLTSVLKGFCNAGEVVLMAWLLERWFGRSFAFGDLRRVAAFFAAAALATATSAIGGAMTMITFHVPAPFWGAWLTWFTSGTVGIVVVAPLLIELGQLRREPSSRAHLIEGAGVLALTALASMYALSLPTGSWLSYDTNAVVFPLLLWLVVRNQRTFAIAGGCVVSIATIGATILGIGHFGDVSASTFERVLGAQLVAIVVIGFTLVLTALFAERKKSEDGLRESEERLRLAQLKTGVGIWDWNVRTGKAAWTPELEVIFGLPQKGVRFYADFRDRVHPDDIEAVEAQRDAAVRRRETFNIEFRIVRPDGQVRWISAVGGAFYDEATGEPARILGNNIDITERKQAEQVLAERNAQLSLAGRAARVGSFAYNADREDMQISEGYAAIYGFPEGTSEIARSQCLASVHPQDVERPDLARSEAFRERRSEYSVEHRVIRPGGEVRWVETRCFISYDSEGRPQRLVGVSIDNTDRKQAEARLAERNAQFDLARRVARVGTYTYDNISRTMLLSEASAEILGLPQGITEIRNDVWRSLVHPDDLPRLDVERRYAFKERQPELVGEFRIVRPDGEARWIEARAFISYDGDGRACRMIGVYIDVTERRQAENQKSLLIAELDHRVKNTLACVAAVAQRTHDTAKSMDEFIRVLDGRIQSLANTHSLLSRNRWQGVSIAELVRGELAPCMKDGNTLIDGPETVLAAEATQPVSMVLHELVTNATKYGALSNSRGRVLICWRRHSNGDTRSNLVLEWREVGGPPVAVPNHTGYGTSVIRDLIPYELGGTVDHELGARGARCRVEIPAKWLNAT
jgi:PAS domain S-box-containing protein